MCTRSSFGTAGTFVVWQRIYFFIEIFFAVFSFALSHFWLAFRRYAKNEICQLLFGWCSGVSKDECTQVTLHIRTNKFNLIMNYGDLIRACECFDRFSLCEFQNKMTKCLFFFFLSIAKSDRMLLSARFFRRSQNVECNKLNIILHSENHTKNELQKCFMFPSSACQQMHFWLSITF